MELFARILVSAAYYLLIAMEFLMLLRAVLSLFPLREDNKIAGFVALITEPLILPWRNLFYRLNWFQNTPLDVPFLFAYLVLMLASYVFALLF